MKYNPTLFCADIKSAITSNIKKLLKEGTTGMTVENNAGWVIRETFNEVLFTVKVKGFELLNMAGGKTK